MVTYMIVPSGHAYWIVETSPGGALVPIERFDDEGAAIRRLRVLQKTPPSFEQQNIVKPLKGFP